jgi:copper transport protein
MSSGARRFVVAGVTAGALFAAPVAWGHAVLVATTPANDAVVAESPDEVVLRWNEPVEGALGAVQVYDGNGERVDDDEIGRPSSAEMAVGIDGDLRKGTYTVAWRVVSADSDPISGAFVFHVEAPGPHPSGIAAQVLEDTPALTSVVYTGARFFEFLLLILCAGGVAALVYALRSADERVHRRLYGLLALCAGSLAVFSLLGLPLQGAAAAASGLREAFTRDVVTSVAETRYGKVELIRVGLALALGLTALLLRRARGSSQVTGLVAAALLAAGLAFTPPFAGHAGVSGTLAITADVAHVIAASMWVGGLAFVVVALVLALEERWPLATRSVPRFSTMAVIAVGLLLAGGVVNGYLEVRTWRGLWETQYGLLLMAKIALVLPLLALGAYNNRYAVPRLRSGVAQPRERRRFLQTASVELGIMVVIVGVTAVLVNSAPAKDALEMHAGTSAAQMIDLGDGLMAHVETTPATAGPNTLHIQFDHHGAPAGHYDEVTIAASLPEREIGPIIVEARRAGPGGEWRAEADFAIPGEWEIRLEARQGEFDLNSGTTTIQIREGT